MCSDHIPVPFAYADYRGAIRVTYRYDGGPSGGTQPIGPIPRRPAECRDDCYPEVIVQALNNGGQENGPAWYWDEELDHGRGAWVTYDPRIHDKVEVEEVVVKPTTNPETVANRVAEQIVSNIRDKIKDAALPDVGTPSTSIDLDSSSKVELNSEAAPTSDSLSFPAESEVEGEPSFEDED